MRELVDLIAECRAGKRGVDAKAVARERDAALIFADMGAIYTLTQGADLWVRDDYDEGTCWRRVTDRRERSVVLTLASRNHPFLQRLLPVRPSTASDCAKCEATGFWRVKSADGEPFGFPCQECGALGWLDTSEGESGEIGG